MRKAYKIETAYAELKCTRKIFVYLHYNRCTKHIEIYIFILIL